MKWYLFVILGMSVVIIILCILLFLKKKRITELRMALDAYLKTGKSLPYSLREGDLALLQNELSDLVTRLELEKQRAKDVDRKNAEFAADVSHQLKTPLAGLRLYCELDAQNGNPNAEKELRLIEKTEKLVAELLKLQKIRADSFDFVFEDAALEMLTEETFAAFRPLYPQKYFEVTSSAVLRCNRAWLNEAISNIVKNACEHTPEDGQIRAAIEDSDESVTLTLEDNGGGVPAAELPHLFERFYKAKNASPDSTGLGLAITKEIVSKHHGTITAENAGEGLRLTLCFPKIDANVKINV
ncbi:MAG: HAMP domain-containing histidine kinase [Clostridia bacterium]|nr:HAMP domain-containing histidine kinase [Clostridia bacterium]